MSSSVSPTLRKRSVCIPTKPAIQEPAPLPRTVTTRLGSLNRGPFRICLSQMGPCSLMCPPTGSGSRSSPSRSFDSAASPAQSHRKAQLPQSGIRTAKQAVPMQSRLSAHTSKANVAVLLANSTRMAQSVPCNRSKPADFLPNYPVRSASLQCSCADRYMQIRTVASWMPELDAGDVCGAAEPSVVGCRKTVTAGFP